MFTVVGTNANGILSKKDSMIQIVEQLKPSVLCLQESKVNRKGLIKIPGYEIFEYVRSNSNGGCLLTAIHSNLQPVFISGEESEAKILVVQAKLGPYNCRFINAYGPQEYASQEEKIVFYARLDQEVKNAKLFDCLICIEMDANAKVGCDIIKHDPNTLSGNGVFFLDFIQRNNLVIGNSTDLCEGTITRSRVTINGHEKSVLDYFVMCQELYLLLNSMIIDEGRTMVLTRYSKVHGQTVVKKSDHNLLYCKFKQSWNNKITSEKSRYEIFNFKNCDGIKKFEILTSSDTLSKCFKGNDIIQESNQWLKHFKNILQRSFKKIRITEPRQKSEVLSQMREKASFMQKLQTLEQCLEIANKNQSQCIISKIVLVKSEIEEIEINISNLISNRNVKKIKEHFLTLSDAGSFSVPGMWSLKNCRCSNSHFD